MAKKKPETVLSVLKEIRDSLKPRVAVEVKGSSRFIDNNDGTVTDSKTGLIWVKNPHTDLPDNFKKELSWNDAVQACKDLHFAGKKDWRLPTVEELASLVDYSKCSPAIDTKSFPDTKSSWYWTKTPYAGSADSVWCVSFYGGYVGNCYKVSNSYVRPVRVSQ